MRRWIGAGLGLLLLGVVGAAYVRRAAPAPPSAAAVEAPLPRTSLREARSATYAFTYESTSSRSFGVGDESPLEARVELGGDLVVETFPGAGQGAVTVVMHLARVARAEVVALGRPTLSTSDAAARTLEATTVRVDLKDAEVQRVTASGGATLEARLVQEVATDFVARVLAGSGLPTATSEGAGGVAMRVLVRDPKERHVVHTELVGFMPFEDGVGAPEARGEVAARDASEAGGSGRVRVGADGAMLEASAEERVRDRARASATSLRVRFELRHLGPALREAPPDPAEADDDGELADDVESRRRQLERRASAVTMADVVTQIHASIALPGRSDQTWIASAAAYLAVHEPEAEALVASARTAELAFQTRAFDLVVIAGHPRGQRAMVSALARGGWAEAAPDDVYTELVQRLGHLELPTVETLAFVERERRAAARRAPRSPRSLALAYTLGAVARARGEVDRPAARRAMTELVGDLRVAKTAEEQAALLRAVGNGSFSEDAAEVLAFASSPDPGVRAAVASALRNMRAPDGAPLTAIVGLLSDAEGTVARSAAQSFARRDVSELEALDWTLLGSVHPDARGPLADFLLTRRGDLRAADAVLERLAADPDTDGKLRQRIASALRGA